MGQVPVRKAGPGGQRITTPATTPRAPAQPPNAAQQPAQQPPGRSGAGRPPAQQPAEQGGQHGQDDDQGEQNEQPGGDVATTGRGGQHQGADAHMGILDGVKETLLTQTLLWHANAVAGMLGIDSGTVAVVLRNVADQVEYP